MSVWVPLVRWPSGFRTNWFRCRRDASYTACATCGVKLRGSMRFIGGCYSIVDDNWF